MLATDRFCAGYGWRRERDSLCLPPRTQAISKPFGELAEQIVATLPRNPERTTALRKLLEAKDCAVRAQLFKE